MRSEGKPDRCTSLVLHYEAGHREYDIWATDEMSEDQYIAAIEQLRRLEDVQWILRKLGRMESLPPAGDGLIEDPRPSVARWQKEDVESPQPGDSAYPAPAAQWLEGDSSETFQLSLPVSTTALRR